MASTGAECEEPHLPQDEPRHPEPAFREAQKWIEEVTGRSFGENDFRSSLENGILLCELLGSIRPDLVQKINRLPTPIAGLDNLSVFLRGCEELGLKGSQLFDPGDLQDTSVRANLRDSDCSRKLKNVLITVFWLGKASSGCPSYDGPVLNLREFEGLRSHMTTVSEDRSGSDSVRPGVRDSGYDCWDSERSQSLSPPQHTRDDSLDSLDSFGSRSQTSPSPDVIILGNSDGDSEGDAPNRKPDVRRDDMLARRTAAGESRTFVPFNQFLPNRSNVSTYVPTARRRPRPQDGEHGSLPQPILEEGREGEGGGPFKRPPGPRSRNPKTVTWAPDGEGPKEEEGGHGQEEEVLKWEVEERQKVQRLEKAGIKVLPAVIRYGRPTPPPEKQEVRSPSPNIILRRHNDFLTNQKAAWDSDSEGEAEGEEGGGGGRKVPDVRRDDLASRRAPRPPAAPRVHQYIPPPACSLRDRELWEDIRRSSHTALMERSEKEAVCDIITRRDNPFLNPAPQREEEEEEEERRGGGVKVLLPNKTKDDLARRRAQNRSRPSHSDGPMSFVHASITQSDLEKWERLKMSEPSESSPSPVCQACLEKGSGTPDIISTATGSIRGRSKFVTFGGVTELEEQSISSAREGEESQLLRRLLAKATVAMPIIGLGSQLSEQPDSHLGGVDDSHSHTPPPNPGPSSPLSPEAPPTLLELETHLAQYERAEREEEEGGGRDGGKVPDLQKDDMMARRTGAFPRTPITMATTFNRFLPLPGGSKRPAQEVVTERKLQQPRVSMDVPQQHLDVAMVVRPPAPSHCNYDDDEDEEDDDEDEGERPVPDLEKDDMLARRTGAFQCSAGGTGRSFNLFLPVPGAAQQKNTPAGGPNQLYKNTPSDGPNQLYKNTLSGGPNQLYKNTPSDGPNQLYKNTPSDGTNQLYRHRQQPSSGVSTATGPEAPPSRTPTRKCLEDNPYLSSPSIPLSSHTLNPPPTPPLPQLSGRTERREEGRVRGEEIEKEMEKQREMETEKEREERGEERGEEREKEREMEVGESHRRPFWLEDNDLPPMMLSRRVSKRSEELESISMIDMRSEEEGARLLQPLGQSRYEGMQEQYTNHQEEEEEWQEDLARWKSRRRSASQDLIRKEEERKRMERMMKEEEGGHTQKRKNIKTYREIVEDKERREAELCDAYRRAGSKEEAAMVLQRYALRFTISDATLDSLQLPRTTTIDQNPESRTTTTNQNPESRTITTDQNPESRTTTTDHNPESNTITNQNPDPRTITTQNPDPRTITTDQNPERAGNGLEARQADTKQEPRAPKQPKTTVTHTEHTHTKHTHTEHTQLQNTQHAHTQNHSTQCQHTLPPPISPPHRPLALLTAEPYCQPSHQQPGLKPVKVDDSSPLHSPPPTEHPGANQKTDASAISALIGGRNCVVTTTIVTELTQTHLQPRPSDMPSNTQVNSSLASSRRSGEEAGSDSSLLSNQHTYSSSVTEGLEGSSVTIESPMLNLAKRVDHWVWNPEDERRRQERWQLEQERFLQEQYLREQEKLKVVWERAQREVDEEERRHNEEEKRILEETATALSHFPPIELPVQTEVIVPAQQIYASWDCESSRGQETSLDRNQPSVVKRSGSYDGPHPPSSSPSSPQPPSPSRCVSGKRQCSGCNQALGKGTAMNIDKLGLYFHLTCFKCGVCKGQLGDTSSGTDIRIGNGLLSCHDCYVTSHAAGQPTTL